MIPKIAITFFMYHDIRDLDCTDFPRRYQGTSFLTTSQFDGQLDYITKHYGIVSLADVVLARTGKKLPPHPAVLTFDDGLLDHFTQVFPRLSRRGLPGTFFVPTVPVEKHRVMHSHKIQFILAAVSEERHIIDEIFAELDYLRASGTFDIPPNQDLWDRFSISLWGNNTWTLEMVFVTRLLREGLSSGIRQHLADKLFSSHVSEDEAAFAKGLYMSVDQIRCLVKGGMEVGGHGYDSVDLSLLSAEEKRVEIVQNFEFLRDRVFDRTSFPFFFSYPHGGVDEISVEVLRQIGCLAALTTRSELEFDLADLLRLPRFNAPCVFPHEGEAAQSTPTQIAHRYNAGPETLAKVPIERAGWRIVLCGVQEQGLEITDFLFASGIPVSFLVTIPQPLAMKNKAAGWVSYEQFARDKGIPIYHAKTYGFSAPEDHAFFQRHAFDVMILGGWQRLIPEEVLKTLRIGGIGQHGSSEYLPRGRGRSPLNWSLIQDRRRLVWNLFMLSGGVDNGSVVDTQVFEINDWDTCRTLYYKVSVSVKRMLARTIPKLIAGEIEMRSQAGEPTFYAKRTPDDGLINWSGMSVREIYNLVRAVTHPYPGAFTQDADGQVVHIWSAQPWDAYLPFYSSAQYGEVVECFADGAFVVNCVDGLLLVLDADDSSVFLGKVYSSVVDPGNRVEDHVMERI